MMLKWTKLISINLTIFSLCVLLLEGVLYLLYTFPPRIDPILRAVRKYHLTYERRTLHYMNKCFVYDKELAYVLRPEGCRYNSREFEIEIVANSAGFRDTEEALKKPEIIVMGDSQAFGWGVSGEETFAKQLEKITGRRTLNTGIPSYGTYRETQQLLRADLSSVKFIIIQYSDNDIGENIPFVAGGYKLNVRSEDKRLKLAEEELKRANDAPLGQYLRRFWPLLFNYLKTGSIETTSPVRSERRSDREASLFLDIIGRSDCLPKNIPILVLEINSYNLNDPFFIRSLGEKIRTWGKKEQHPIIPMDLSELLDDTHYFVHDDHINPSGHRLIAEVLAEKIKTIKRRSLSPEPSYPLN